MSTGRCAVGTEPCFSPDMWRLYRVRYNGAMAVSELGTMTWKEFAAVCDDQLICVLPVGATEAHGPHLPLETDVIIAQAMARAGATRLSAKGRHVVVLPPLAYTVAGFAEGFAGTISIRADTAVSLLQDIAAGLARHGAGTLVFANAHLEPGHIASLRRAAKTIEAAALMRVVFPDVTRKPWALRLTDEFKSGACHAGQYEGSIVMSERPDLVRDAIRRDLAPNPASLSTAIREGKSSFEAAGGPEAYFGYPADATAAEGRETIDVLGAILADATLERLDEASASA